MNCLALIDSYYPSLSPREKKVANYIRKNRDKLIYQSIQEISKELGIGEATVVRFCKKLGFDGFRDFKLEIAKESEPISKKKLDNYVDAIISNFHNTVDDTYSVINNSFIEKVAQWINKADRVFLYGVGASHFSALDMASRLLRYGKVVHVETDAHFQIMSASILSSRDLVIAFSINGGTNEVIEVAELAKKNSAKIVAVTNYIMSPLSNLADITLLTSGKESPIDGGSLAGRLSQLLIVDLVCTAYALIDEGNSEEMRSRTALSIVNKHK